MVFTTLETTPRLGEAGRRRLSTMSPGRVFAPSSYHTMITRAGLSPLIERDVTRRFKTTLRALIAANERHAEALTREVGRGAFDADLRWYRDRLAAAHEGLIRRMLYVCARRS